MLTSLVTEVNFADEDDYPFCKAAKLDDVISLANQLAVFCPTIS
jgi:hypothetical protein